MRNPFRRDENLWPYEYEQLARYNAERLRGILHDPKWIEYMAEVQARYNEEHGLSGLIVHADGSVT